MFAFLRLKVLRCLLAVIVSALLLGGPSLPNVLASECPSASASTCT
jgi:hypothetical protein